MTHDATSLRAMWARNEWHRLVPELQQIMRAVMPLSALSEPDLADELCQRALIRVWSCPYVPEDPAAWVNRVVHNLYLDVLKSAHYRSHDGSPVPADEIENNEESADEKMERMQALGRLREALRSLPDPLRRCLVLHDLHGRSCSDIGRQFGLTEGAVKMRLHRARRMLSAIYKVTPAPPLNEKQEPVAKKGRRRIMTWARLVNVP